MTAQITSQWLSNCVKNAPVEFVRASAAQIQQTGYLTLGDFFEYVSDIEIKSILQLYYQVGNEKDQTIVAEAQTGISLLTTLLCIGSNLDMKDAEQNTTYMQNLALYFLHEINDRQFICDRKLRAKRLLYSIEIKPKGN